MNIIIRESDLSDLPALEKIEENSFPEFQKSSRRSLRHSISTPFQKVFIAEIKSKKDPVGSLVIYIHQRSLRIYSIAVLPQYQSKGVGHLLMEKAFSLAKECGFDKVSLEVLSTNQKLIKWYESFGFEMTAGLPDYYCEGIDGIRMTRFLAQNREKGECENIIVVDNPSKWKLDIEGVRVISSKNYIAGPEFQAVKNVRVFNLSKSYRYQSMGYYVSLLASARDHRAIPNVTTIRDFRNVSIIRTIAHDIDELLQETLSKHKSDSLNLNIYFGHTIQTKYRTLGQNLYRLFETPLMNVQFNRNQRWVIQNVSPLSLDKVDDLDFERIQQFARSYFTRKRFEKPKFHNYKYDLAILVNPNEGHPPSNPQALQYFKEAAKKTGFYCEFITKDDYDRLSEFDALFIRETTNVNDYTYHFSRTAYAEGLIVIDDPWSILRCSNKIYLNERMKQNKILTPQTYMLTRETLKKKEFSKLTFPLVLKQPDSAFSLGVTKVDSVEELICSLTELLKKSELVIGQEFLYSEYDWRIGILDQKPLFCCKYYMAKDHWQIINWNSDIQDDMGDADTIPVEEVPEPVIKAALKAAALMGDGLYGVDLKMIGNKPYIIEVNDNPNIDAGIEDVVLKEELYLKVMQSFYNRIEMSRNIARFVSIDSRMPVTGAVLK